MALRITRTVHLDGPDGALELAVDDANGTAYSAVLYRRGTNRGALTFTSTDRDAATGHALRSLAPENAHNYPRFYAPELKESTEMTTSTLTDPTPRCLEEDATCTGTVELRPSLAGTGTPIARCDGHWQDRLSVQSAHDQRFPELPPPDFDPHFAGERWDEEA